MKEQDPEVAIKKAVESFNEFLLALDKVNGGLSMVLCELIRIKKLLCKHEQLNSDLRCCSCFKDCRGGDYTGV